MERMACSSRPMPTISSIASLIKLGVQVTQALNVGRFSEGQRWYLRFHRESALLRSKYLDDA